MRVKSLITWPARSFQLLPWITFCTRSRSLLGPVAVQLNAVTEHGGVAGQNAKGHAIPDARVNRGATNFREIEESGGGARTREPAVDRKNMRRVAARRINSS